MDMNGFKKISDTTAANIYGGNFLAIVGTILPILLQMLFSGISSFKLLSSDKGEVRTNDGTISKWENSKNANGVDSLTKLHFIS